MGNSIPNFDAMDESELQAWWKEHQQITRTQAATIFPGRPKGYLRITQDLANYAVNKITAMQLRLKGKIEQAQVYEGICERIYADLPDFARW